MDFIVRGRAAGGATSRGELKTSSSRAEVWLDGQRLYFIPHADWADYCAAMQASAPPPNLPARAWSVTTLDSAYLRDGERMQVLHSLIHLSESIPQNVLFSSASFGQSNVAGVFFDQQMRDGHGNLLYVPDGGAQRGLTSNPADRAAVVGTGYVFEAELEDDSGDKTEFLFRPYNSWFAESRRWRAPLQGLRGQIEARRHRP